MKYRKLQGYKYELMEYIEVPVALPDVLTMAHYVIIKDGKMAIRGNYAWDGASGPTFDDKTNMRASLVHDALYQLMREGLLDREHRKYADELFRDICIQDGMNKFRAAYYYRAVRIFGRWTCLKEKNPRGAIIEI